MVLTIKFILASAPWIIFVIYFAWKIINERNTAKKLAIQWSNNPAIAGYLSQRVHRDFIDHNGNLLTNKHSRQLLLLNNHIYDNQENLVACAISIYYANLINDILVNRKIEPHE